jgi:hypothetical protein
MISTCWTGGESGVACEVELDRDGRGTGVPAAHRSECAMNIRYFTPSDLMVHVTPNTLDPTDLSCLKNQP